MLSKRRVGRRTSPAYDGRVTSIGLVGRAVANLAVSRILLGRIGTTGTLRRLTGRRRPRPDVEPQQALIAVRRAAQIVGGVCLPQAVALAALLQRHGHTPTVILGCLRVPDGSWSAHAWVQLEDAVLEPVVSSGHTALACLRAADGWVPSAVPSSEPR